MVVSPYPQPEGGDPIRKNLVILALALVTAAIVAGASWGGNSWSEKPAASWSS